MPARLESAAIVSVPLLKPDRRRSANILLAQGRKMTAYWNGLSSPETPRLGYQERPGKYRQVNPYIANFTARGPGSTHKRVCPERGLGVELVIQAVDSALKPGTMVASPRVELLLSIQQTSASLVRR